MTPMLGKRWGIATGLAFVVAFAATAPSVADFGYTYDEPAYRHSQMVSAQWWEGIARGNFRGMLEPDALLYYWPYGRHGINFHPPLAGQLNLLTYAVFGGVMKDVPARRMASVLEFAATVALLFGFMAGRYGAWVGVVSAGSLLFMPRLFGQAHLIDTDTPGLLLWASAACAFWRGITVADARWSRNAVGVIVGLAFVEKMAAVLVALPIVAWLALGPLPRAILRRDRSAWRDGLATSALMVIPLGIAYAEIVRLKEQFLRLQVASGVGISSASPARTDLFRDHPATWVPGAILLLPLIVWLVRALIRRKARSDRPALEIWLSMLAFGPAIAWLGNPAWWREALPRLAHYYAITTARRGVLPDIQIIYFGQIYEFSLPWHNAWVLLAITVPASILIAAVVGLVFAPWRDRLPWFFLVNLATLPIMRMFPTPAHDGVRLFLPTFFFLASFAGWGTIGLAERIGRRGFRPLLAALVLAPAAWALVRVHPYELSYYNEFISGARGAWHHGFELSYWYDAFNDDVLEEINAKLPSAANVSFANVQSAPVPVLDDEQALGMLRGDIQVEVKNTFPYLWLLTHDSKADAFSRLLFAMNPWYASRPAQLGGLRVATVADPISASRAWALQLLLDRTADREPPDPPQAPAWVRTYVPPLARLWGDGLTRARPLGVDSTVLEWARDDPDGLRNAARDLVATRGRPHSPDASRLRDVLNRYPDRAARLFQARPEALVEAVEIVVKRPRALRSVLLRQGYTDPDSIGGYLDD